MIEALIPMQSSAVIDFSCALVIGAIRWFDGVNSAVRVKFPLWGKAGDLERLVRDLDLRTTTRRSGQLFPDSARLAA